MKVTNMPAELRQVIGWEPVTEEPELTPVYVGPGGQNLCWELRTENDGPVYFTGHGSAELMRQGCEFFEVGTALKDANNDIGQAWTAIVDHLNRRANHYP